MFFINKKNDFFILSDIYIKMSVNKQIVEAIKSFLDDNQKCTKKEFLAACGNAFGENKTKGKGAKKQNDGEKKELSGYQKFVKEQMPILKAREDKKDESDTKKKASELMKEIGELWQLEKSK